MNGPSDRSASCAVCGRFAYVRGCVPGACADGPIVPLPVLAIKESSMGDETSNDDARIEAAAQAIHETPGTPCPLCILGSIPSTPSWDELREESKERHRGAARLVAKAVRETMAEQMEALLRAERGRYETVVIESDKGIRIADPAVLDHALAVLELLARIDKSRLAGG
jgi:hypothetical protein